MNFYYNENNLLNDEKRIIESIKEVKNFYDVLKNSGNKLLIKNDFNPYSLTDFRKLGAIAGFIKYIETFEKSDMWLEKNEIEPWVENCFFIELISSCYVNSNELIVSSEEEKEIIEEKYFIKTDEFIVKNIVGKKELVEFILHNPIPSSISEVFERSSINFKKVQFTKRAYESGAVKNDFYKNFGFEKILDIFKIIEKELYPFFRGDLEGENLNSIQEKFKIYTGVEFSAESEATLKKYGEERTVSYNNRKILMSYHIKIKGDCRIYFNYEKIEDCILIGHAGGHLKTIKYK